MIDVNWATAFIDLPPSNFHPTVAFWQAITSSGRSAVRGDRAQFATLLPADGDPYLRVQRVESGPAGCHLDLHVTDVEAATAETVRLGAEIRFTEADLAVLTAPDGFVFCLVREPNDEDLRRPAPVRWPSGDSLVDQLCLDIPAPDYEQTVEFWATLTGWELRVGALPAFRSLLRPAGIPLRLLLQRTDDQAGPGRAHLDLAALDVGAEAARHRALGADVVRVEAFWTTLRDPAGLEYCITARDPATGLR